MDIFPSSFSNFDTLTLTNDRIEINESVAWLGRWKRRFILNTAGSTHCESTALFQNLTHHQHNQLGKSCFIFSVSV